MYFKVKLSKLAIEILPLLVVIVNDYIALAGLYLAVAVVFYGQNLNIPIGICIGYILTLLVLREYEKNLSALQNNEKT